MLKIHIVKHTVIDKPANKVFSCLHDFHQWPAWSPWLIMDPEAKVEVAGDGKLFSWEGTRVGSGEMRITAAQNNHVIHYDLLIRKPWKSSSRVKFETQGIGRRTNVYWYMESSLPFFMFWMKRRMSVYMGMDCERGLLLLKDYIESGKTHSKLNFLGSGNRPECAYIGIKRTTGIPALGKNMSEDMQRLRAYAETGRANITGPAFSVYHQWDVIKEKVSYTSAIPVRSIPDDLPTGLITGRIPAAKTYTLEHIGPYRHLGNAWATMYTMHRNKEFLSVKDYHPFEEYINQPGSVPDQELITRIHFGIK